MAIKAADATVIGSVLINLIDRHEEDRWPRRQEVYWQSLYEKRFSSQAA
jgi:hypothetical protein